MRLSGLIKSGHLKKWYMHSTWSLHKTLTIEIFVYFCRLFRAFIPWLKRQYPDIEYMFVNNKASLKKKSGAKFKTRSALEMSRGHYCFGNNNVASRFLMYKFTTTLMWSFFIKFKGGPSALFRHLKNPIFY